MSDVRRRLDTELVRQGLAPTRSRAAELIVGGRVRVDGTVATKPGLDVSGRSLGLEPATDQADEEAFVSRAGRKLAGALRDLPALNPSGLRCLDAGASTGGFTEVLLRHRAREVIAVDVGHGQLVSTLRRDPRVQVLEGCNVRSLSPEDIGGVADLTVADLSFISLTLVLEALTACTHRDGDLLLLVKPQFEVGRQRLGRGGVVRDVQHRVEVVQAVGTAAYRLGWGSRGVTRSAVPGASGNVEFFLWLQRGAAALDPEVLSGLARPGPPAVD